MCLFIFDGVGGECDGMKSFGKKLLIKMCVN